MSKRGTYKTEVFHEANSACTCYGEKIYLSLKYRRWSQRKNKCENMREFTNDKATGKQSQTAGKNTQSVSVSTQDVEFSQVQLEPYYAAL